jgi:hypothetical protein
VNNDLNELDKRISKLRDFIVELKQKYKFADDSYSLNRIMIPILQVLHNQIDCMDDNLSELKYLLNEEFLNE